MNKYDNIFKPNSKRPDNNDDLELELIDQLMFESLGMIPPGYTKIQMPALDTSGSMH